MIFCTIGTQAPFDRFIKIIDEIAPLLNEEIVAQTLNGKYKPQNIKTVGLIPPSEFENFFSKARLIVAHAGVGTILSALTKNKPIIIFPRLASLKEHRNEHQMATAQQMEKLGFVHVAYNEETLKRLLLEPSLPVLKELGNTASPELIDEMHRIIG